MSHPPVTITAAAPVRAAAKRLESADVGSLIVLVDGEPVGIVTESDIVGLLAADIDPDETAVETPMSRPLVRVDADDPLERAATTLRRHDIKRAPVFDDGDLVGVVSVRDLSFYLPALGVGRGVGPADAARVRVGGPGLAFEEEGWAFTYRDAHQEGVGVGDAVRFTKRLEEADVRRFARASGDTNRLHLDAAFARETRFGRPIVHGTLVLGVISAALARIPGLTIYLSQEVSFLGPVPVGEPVTATCRIVEDLGEGRFQLTTVVTDAEGDTVVDGEAIVLIDPLPSDEAADSPAAAAIEG